MACLHPIIIRKKITNLYSQEKFIYDKYMPDKKNPLYDLDMFISDDAKSELYNTKSTPFIVGCGKCLFCRRKRVNSWFVRSKFEMSSYNDKQFTYMVTLTYSDVSNPSLDYRDVQLFLKSLRKKGFKFKYICVGEYGFQTLRKHWHLILFGMPFLRKKHLLFQSVWRHGFNVVKLADANSIRYLLKYTTKQLFGHDEKFFIDKGLVPPMFHCSQKIGYDYYFKHKDELLRSGVVKLDNYNYSIPRYFRKKMVFDDCLINNSYFLDNYDPLVGIHEELRHIFPYTYEKIEKDIFPVDKSFIPDIEKCYKKYISLTYTYYEDLHKVLLDRERKKFKEAI